MTTLSGGTEELGIDSKNGLLFANHNLLNDKYEFIIEDDQCAAKSAIAAANRLVNKHQVKYVLGTVCNESLLATAPIFNKAGTIVLASAATSGDQANIGKRIFRLFPNDKLGAHRIFPLIKKVHKHLAILTQQDAFTVMMERTLQKLNSEVENPIKITSEFENPDTTDFRPALLRLKKSGADALYANMLGDSSFIEIVKQIKELNWDVQIYSVYFSTLATSINALGKMIEGILFANVPKLEDNFAGDNKDLYGQYVNQYGEPLTLSLGVLTAIESLRILDQALTVNQDIETYLKQTTFQGLLGNLTFDADGANNSTSFQIQKVVDGKMVVVE